MYSLITLKSQIFTSSNWIIVTYASCFCFDEADTAANEYDASDNPQCPQWYRKCTANQFADLRVKLQETSKGNSTAALSSAGKQIVKGAIEPLRTICAPFFRSGRYFALEFELSTTRKCPARYIYIARICLSFTLMMNFYHLSIVPGLRIISVVIEFFVQMFTTIGSSINSPVSSPSELRVPVFSSM